MEHFTHMGNWLVVLVTLAAIAVTISVHYEVLRGCLRYLPEMHNRRGRVVLLILVILATHSAEIWIFALGYRIVLGYEPSGTLVGIELTGMLDYAYYSGMVYTTVGFGDVYPVGPIRFMSGMEALSGLVMITWSASFTFLEMQRDWPATRGGRS